MAEGKKSFLAYADWKNIFDELPNEEAGMLIKHIFAYVNDENPVSESVLVRAVFAPIKSTLKRDLVKWETQLQQRKDAGKLSAEQRRLKKEEQQRNLTTVETRSTDFNGEQRNSTVSVSVNVNDNVNVKEDSMLVKTASPYAKKIIPTLDEVIEYLVLEKNESQNEAERFFDYYQANGWRVGKNPMKDWKAAARNWLKNKSNYNKQTLKTNENGKQLSKQELEQQEFNRRYGTTFGQ